MVYNHYSNPLNTSDRIIRINEDLMIHLDSTIRWILHYCEKNNINPPNLDILNKSIQKTHEYLNPSYQPQGNINNNYREGNSTLKQHSYKVQVPYYTV